MQIYLNECSFHEQFHDRNDLEKAFRVFAGVLQILQRITVGFSFYREPHLPYMAFPAEVLVASINKIREKSLIQLIFDSLNKIHPADWREHPVHSAYDRFLLEELDVSDTSLAELSERQFCETDEKGCLINFSGSRFGTALTIEVKKNDSQNCQLDCFERNSDLAAG